MKPYEMKENILQVDEEIESLCDLLSITGVGSYLEIGSKFGGSLWKVANSLPKGSRIVAVDMPKGTRLWQQSEASLKLCVADLKARGYDAHLIWGKSQDMDVIKKVLALGPYDAVMIDADHRLPGLTADWDNYNHMAKCLVAFHDISWKRAPEWIGTRIDVPQFWNSIKESYAHEEFRFCPTKKNNGIGVLWKN